MHPSYCEQSEPSMSSARTSGAGLSEPTSYEDAVVRMYQAYGRSGLLKTQPAAILCVRATVCRPVRFHSLPEGRTLAL